MKRISGIYKITNIINNKSYIGSSVDIYTRWREHKRRSKCKSEWTKDVYESPLYRSFRKNGLENFTFEIIEEVSPNNLLEREQYWYDYYKPEYNRMYPDRALNCIGHKHTDVTKAKISKNNCRYWQGKTLPPYMIDNIIAGNKNKRKQIIMLDKNTKEELRSFDGMCNALRFLGKNPNNTNGIKNCCEGVANTAYGYSWKYFE